MINVPSIHIPDKLVFEIVKLGKDHKKYIRIAILEKLERDGIRMTNRVDIPHKLSTRSIVEESDKK